MNQTLKSLLKVCVCLMAGAVAGATVAKSGILPRLSRQDAGTLLAALPLIVITVLAVHELGHLGGGRLMGFRFHMFAAGPLLIVRDGARIRVKWNRVLSLWGGVASALPVRMEKIHRSMMVFTAGGPAASILFSLLLWPFAHPVTKAASLFSALIGMITLIPMRTSGFVSDGGRLLMFARNPEKARRWCALAVIASLSQAKVRPRDWPGEMLEAARALPDGSADDVAAAWFDHKSALDRGDIERAAAAIEYVSARREQLPKFNDDLISLDLTVFRGLYRGSPVEPPQTKPPFAEALDLELARATSLLSKGDRAEASRIAQAALERASDPVNGICLLTRDLLQEVVRQAGV